MSSTPSTTMTISSPTQILLFWPNIIGYARVLFALYSFIVFQDPVQFFIFYTISFLLDAADGHVARKFNQCSKFGAVLDMVTDRFSTASLVLILSHLYPAQVVFWMLLNVLDLTSHWIGMHNAQMRGESHKKQTKGPWILRMYYERREVLGAVCLFNELFYIFLYMNYFYRSFHLLPSLVTFGSLWLHLAIFCFPLFLFKQIVNVIQLFKACYSIVEYEFEHDFTREK